jgi:hypothetical protein
MSETLASTLMGTSWYLSKSMFFGPVRTDKQASKQVSKQASRQFMFARLFSTRKRINHDSLLNSIEKRCMVVHKCCSTHDRVCLIWVFSEEKQLDYYFIYQSI